MKLNPKIKEKMRRQIFAIRKLNPKIPVVEIPEVISAILDNDSISVEMLLLDVANEMKANGEIQ